MASPVDGDRDPLLDEVYVEVFVTTAQPGSRVRLVHMSSGIEVEASTGATQADNMRLALAELRKRLSS